MNSTNEQNWRILCPLIKGHAREDCGKGGAHLTQRERDRERAKCDWQTVKRRILLFSFSFCQMQRKVQEGEGEGENRKNSKLIEQFKANFCFSRLATVSCDRWGCRCQKGHDRHGRERSSQWVSERLFYWFCIIKMSHTHTYDVCAWVCESTIQQQ